MIGSFFSGVSGLKDHLLWLDVIGENLSNVNTTGFKRSRVTFEDILNQNLTSAAAPRGEVGGVNPMQVGLGSTLATIQVVHTQGKILGTERNTDLAIQGEDSFFIVADGISNTSRYTKNGSFDFDAQGNLVNLSNGFKVLGWNAERDGVTNQLVKDDTGNTIIDVTDPLSSLKVVMGDIMPGKPTNKLTFKEDLGSMQELPVSYETLSFIKGVTSVVSVSQDQRGIKTGETWDKAGFNEVPDGTININGVVFKVGGDGEFTTLNKLMNAVNLSAAANVTMKFENDKLSLLPDSPDTQIALAETPNTPGRGLFTQSFIKAGTEEAPYVYNANTKMEIQFEHILDPTNPDRQYYRWKAVDPSSTQLISTNAYHYARGDILQGTGAIAPEAVIGHKLGIGDSTTFVFELPYPDVDPASIQVYVKESNNTTILATPGKYDITKKGFSTYYFDDDSGTDYVGRTNPLWPAYPAPNTKVDRIVFNGAPAAGAIITVDYRRNGFNMHNSTVAPSELKVKVNGEDISGAAYKFNNNQGVDGTDQITFYSAVSTDEVVLDVLNTKESFARAGFNWNIPLSGISANNLLSSAITFKWQGGQWSSAKLSTYRSVAEFMAAINNGTGGIVGITYDPKDDKFTMTNTRTVSIAQSNACGFFTVAKLKGEGTKVSSLISGHSYVTVSAGENPVSREEVVSNKLDLTLPADKCGFNNVNEPISSILVFSWVVGVKPNGNFSWASWKSAAISSYTSMEKFLDAVNDAVDEQGNDRPLPIILRYDPERDRFTMVNTSREDWPVLAKQKVDNPKNGFLTRTHLLTEGLGAVTVPVSMIKPTDVVTADYYYNKTVEAKGILRLDGNGKVIDNFVDTEASPEIISSSKVLGKGTLDLDGGWGQFDTGSVDGTITITTKSGTYRSKDINSAHYPTIGLLIQEVNTSEAKVVLNYNPEVDKFTLKSAVEGDEITLAESGLNPFFTAVNITTGKIVGGNNNSVMDLAIEVPTPKEGWKETTGLYGTGRDYFRVNIAPNEIRAEEVGKGGKGQHGTQVLHEAVTSDMSSHITLANSDVDENTLAIYRMPTTAGGSPEKLTSASWVFLDNVGPGGRDMIRIKETTPYPYAYQMTYTRSNAFDLDHPDVDKTTLIVKVDGRILAASDYQFEDNRGTNGVDRIILQPNTSDKSPGTIGSGKVTVDYRLTFAKAADVFIPNGNNGPAGIDFMPNSRVGGLASYSSGAKAFMADKGDKITAELEKEADYMHKTSVTLYDAFGNAYKADFLFERLSNNLWLWQVRNPVESEKLAGYGVLAFKEDGTYDSENSQIFESPSDPLSFGSRFKGIYFDPPSTATPPESGGAPPPEHGAFPNKILPNFNEVVQLSSSPSTAKVTAQDGYAIGRIIKNEITLGTDGMIVAKYDNGQTQNVGQIALARFANPSGLSKLDGTNFVETVNSGTPQIGTPGTEGRGKIAPGQLESSNVDLVQEFADMIIAQRAFQANARMVTTSEQMFIDIIALKRL